MCFNALATTHSITVATHFSFRNLKNVVFIFNPLLRVNGQNRKEICAENIKLVFTKYLIANVARLQELLVCLWQKVMCTK